MNSSHSDMLGTKANGNVFKGEGASFFMKQFGEPLRRFTSLVQVAA